MTRLMIEYPGNSGEPPAPRGYGGGLLGLLDQIADAVPLRGANQFSLVETFREAGKFIIDNKDGPHGDYAQVFNGLAKIAQNQKFLRREAVQTVVDLYKALPETDQHTELVARDVITRFATDFEEGVRIAASNGMQKLADTAVARDLYKVALAGRLKDIMEIERESSLRRKIDDVLGSMEAGQLGLLRKAAASLKM